MSSSVCFVRRRFTPMFITQFLAHLMTMSLSKAWFGIDLYGSDQTWDGGKFIE